MSFNTTGDRVKTRSDLGLGYTNNEFYLPIAGCPSIRELEPQLTDQLTLKGNKAKLLHVPLWNHTYYTSLYLIDDVTGELYACHQDELIAIKEQWYLQKEMAEEKYLNSQVNKGVADPMKGCNQIAPAATENISKIPLVFGPECENDKLDRDQERHFQNKLLQQNRQTIKVKTGHQDVTGTAKSIQSTRCCTMKSQEMGGKATRKRFTQLSGEYSTRRVSYRSRSRMS